MSNIKTRYYKGLARVVNLPESGISYAEFDIISNRVNITYGINQPRKRQRVKTRRAPKKFCEFMNGWGTHLYMSNTPEDRIIDEYHHLNKVV